jgi:hypothetical protein
VRREADGISTATQRVTGRTFSPDAHVHHRARAADHFHFALISARGPSCVREVSMRLYCKLALLVLVACAVQVSLSTSVVGDTYFAARCYIASVTGNTAMESRLMAECQRGLADGHYPNPPQLTLVAYHASGSP